MLLSGVVTVPPRAIVDPLTVIPEFTRAVFGMFDIVLLDPDKTANLLRKQVTPFVLRRIKSEVATENECPPSINHKSHRKDGFFCRNIGMVCVESPIINWNRFGKYDFKNLLAVDTYLFVPISNDTTFILLSYNNQNNELWPALNPLWSVWISDMLERIYRV